MEKNKNVKKEVLDALLLPFGITQDYFNETLKSDEKPLGEKTQIKVREKLHPILSPLSSWVADNVLKYFEFNTDAKTLAETSEKGALHFLEQAKDYVDSLQTNLTAHFQQTAPEKVPRVTSTIRCGITNILDRGKTANENLFNSHAENKTSSKEEATRTA